MSLIISHNLSALNTQRNLQGSGESMAKSIEKLSSGYKINVGADDPSGLIISEQLRSQISGLERAVRNSSEAFNLIAIAEGALNEMNSILKKMRALAIHAANSGVTSPEQVSADQAEMDSGIETLNRIANTTRYSDQYLLNGQKQLVYDVTTVVNEPTDHSLLNTKMSRVDQVFKRDGVKMSIGFSGEKNQYQANTDTSAQRAYLEADNANSLCEIDGATVTTKQEFILTGTSGSRLFSFAEGAHIGTIVDNINNVRDSTGIGAALTFASDVRIDRTVNGTYNGSSPNYKPPTQNADPMTGFDDGSYVYQSGDVQIYGAGLNNVKTAKISSISFTPDAAASFKVGFNCDGDGKIYAKVVDKSTNSIEYYKDKDCTMLIGQGDAGFFAATNNSGIPSSPVQNLDGLFIKLNQDFARDLDVYEIAVVGQRLDNQKDMNVTGIQGWTDADNSVMSGINLGVNTDAEGAIFFDYVPVQMEADGQTVKSFEINVYKHPSKQPQFLVASSGVVENNVQTELKDAQGNIIQRAGQTVRIESVLMDDGTDSGLNITLVLPKKSDLDGVTGPTLDEVKATQEYQDYLTKLNDAKEQYAEIQVDYTTAKDSRQKAVDALSDAMSSLKNTQKKEGTLRREIDRIEVRSIEQQSLDAQRDLEIAVIDMEDAARKAILAAENNADYMAVAKAMAAAQPTGPDAPEQSVLQLADQLVQAIQAEIIGGIAFDETNPTAKQGVISNVWGMSPLVGLALSTDDQAAVNSLLSDAYDAATKPELMKSVRDATQQIQDLSTLEDDYQAAKDALADSKTKFDLAVNEAVEAVAAKWENVAGVIEDGDLENLTEAIKNQIITYIGNPGLGLNPNNDAAADLTKNFTRYNWMTDKSDITADAIVAFGLGGGATGSATADQLAALASDIYDQLVAEDEFGDYGAAVQELYKHPDPAWGALPNANAYVTKITNEITTTIEAAKTTALAATPPNNNFANIEDWLTANGETWAALEADLALLITNTVNNGTTGNPNTLALASLTNGTLLGDIKTALTPAIAVVTYPVLNAALSLTTGISGQAAGAAVVDPTPELDALLDTVWNKISNATSDMYEYVKLDADNDAAFTAAGTASLALGTAGTSGPADDVYDAIKVSLGNLDTAATAGVGAGTLPQAVADALAKQLYILSGEEGVDVTVAANLTNNPATQSLIISGILAEIDPAIAAGIDPATLKQFVTEVFTSYVTDTMPGGAAGSLSGAVGAPAGAAGGYFGDYTQLVDDFTELEEIYPNGGSLQRNQDRLDRYLQRVQEAPTTVRNGASTRKAWTSLVNTYGNPSTDANLTKLTEDFGTYVRDLVKLNAEAGTTDQINWKEDVYEHLYDMAQSPTGALRIHRRHPDELPAYCGGTGRIRPCLLCKAVF